MYLAVALTLLAPQETIEFVPREGLELRKTFSASMEGTSEQSMDEHGSMTMSQTSASTLVVVDKVVEAEDGQVLTLERLYEEAEMNMSHEMEGPFGSDGGEMDGECELVDETITFTWDEENEEFSPSGDVNDELLEGLRYDYDFTALLPEGKVEEDATWTVEPEVWNECLDVMSGVPLEWPDPEGLEIGEYAEEEMEMPMPDVEEETDGEIELTFSGTREVDGIVLAVIEISGEVETESLVEFNHDFDEGSSTNITNSTESEEISGTLLWDVKGGHLHSLEVEMEMEGTESSEYTFVFGDQEMSGSSESDSSGAVTLAVSFERL